MAGMEAESGKTPRWMVAAALALPTLAAAIFFAGSLHGGFVYDDRVLVTNQPYIRDLSALGLHEIFTHQDYNRYSPHYLPIRLLSYAVDYRLWGLNPFGFHLTNLLLHILNTILVSLLAMQIAGTAGKGNGALKPLAGGIAGMLFGIHPLQVETVAWVSGRKDLLSTFFVLCAALLYLRSYMRPASKKTDWGMLCSLALFVLGMLSMATAAAFPLVLLAFEIFLAPGAGRGRIRLRIERLAPFFLIDAVIACMDMKLSFKSDLVSTWIGGSAFTHYITVATTPLLYVGKVFRPSQLCVEYSIHAQKVLWNPLVLGAVLFWVLLAVWFISRGRKSPVYATFAAWAVLSLAPVMNLLPTGKLIADRYFYMPSFGLFGLAGYMIARALVGRGAAARTAVLIALCFFIGLFGSATIRRIPDWRSEMTLWKSALKAEPESAVVFQNLGYAYFEEKDYKKAEEYFKKAIEADPGYALAYINLGGLEQQVWRRTGEAIRLFRKALKLDPDNVTARANLALALFDKGDFRDAMEEMIRAAESAPNDYSLLERIVSMQNILESRGIKVVLPAELARKIKKLK